MEVKGRLCFQLGMVDMLELDILGVGAVYIVLMKREMMVIVQGGFEGMVIPVEWV